MQAGSSPTRRCGVGDTRVERPNARHHEGLDQPGGRCRVAQVGAGARRDRVGEDDPGRPLRDPLGLFGALHRVRNDAVSRDEVARTRSASSNARWPRMVPGSWASRKRTAGCSRMRREASTMPATNAEERSCSPASLAPTAANNRADSVSTTAWSTSSRPPGKARYTVAHDTPAWRAMSSTVVFWVPWRERQTTVASITRRRSEGGAADRGSSRSSRVGPGPSATSVPPGAGTLETVRRNLSHCQRVRGEPPDGASGFDTTPASNSERTSRAT